MFKNLITREHERGESDKSTRMTVANLEEPEILVCECVLRSPFLLLRQEAGDGDKGYQASKSLVARDECLEEKD